MQKIESQVSIILHCCCLDPENLVGESGKLYRKIASKRFEQERKKLCALLWVFSQ